MYKNYTFYVTHDDILDTTETHTTQPVSTNSHLFTVVVLKIAKMSLKFQLHYYTLRLFIPGAAQAMP